MPADRSIPRIGAAKSVDRGATWTNLGIILEAPSGSEVCGSTNRFVYGGVGDVSATVDHDWKGVYLYYSNYASVLTGRWGIARFFLTGRSMHYIEFSGR